MADYCGINLWDDSLAEQVYPGADLKYYRWTANYKELTSPLIGISPGESAWVRAWRHDDTTLNSWYAFVFYDDEENAVGSRYARYNQKDSDSGYSVTAPSGASFMRVSAASFGNAEIHLEIAGGGVLMADEDVKVYTRGGRLAFTADTLRNHVGETATLSFWIRLGDGAVEGHYVSFYHYQSSGVSISYDRTVSDITAEWSYRELTGTVVDRGTHNTGAVYDGSSEFYIDYDYNPSAPSGTSFSFGEMWLYDRTGSQKYEVAGIQLTLAGGGGSMTSNGRNLATNSKLLNVRPSETTSNVGRYNNNETLQTREDGFAEIVTNGTWRGIAMYADQTNPQVGEPFTFSCNVRNDSEAAWNASVYMMCHNATGTRVYPPFHVAWIGSNALDAGEERRLAFTATWTQEAVDLLAAGGNIRYSLQANKSDPLAFWAPKLERGTEMTPWRPAPEDSDVVSDMIIATDTKSLAVAVDVQQVDTWYYQTASTGTAPNKPDTASPSGWQTTEYAFDASKAVWSCQKTTLTDGTFYWGAVSKWSAYEGSVVAWNKANAAQDSIDNLEVGGRNLVRRTDYAKYGNWGNFQKNGTVTATFSTDRVTVTYGGEVYHKDYPLQVLDAPIPASTPILCSVYVYRQTVPDGNHRLYVSPIREDGSVWWTNIRTIPTGFTGLLTWTFTPDINVIGFVIDFDMRSGTSGEMVLGRVKAEKGNRSTDWTPAPEDTKAEIAEAAKVAGNYIIETASNDVWIHSEGHGPNSSGVATSDTYGWRIGSVFELVRAGASYMKMWVENSIAKLRLGLESAGHAIFSPDGMEVYGDSTTKVASLTPDGVVVGRSDGARFVADESSVALYSKDTEKVFDVEVGSSASSTTYIGHINVASGQSISSVSVSSEYAIPSFTYVKVNGTSASYSTQAMSSSEILPDGTTTVTTRRAVANLSSAVSGPASVEYAYTVNEPPVTAVVGRKGGNHVEVTSEGFEVFTNRDTSVAEFGEDVRIGMEGGNTLVLNSAGNKLYQAGVEVASFAANLIDIGKNAATTIIRLCAGKGTIEYNADDYDPSSHYLEIKGENLRLRGTSQAALYSHYTDGAHLGRKTSVITKPNQLQMFSQESTNLVNGEGTWTSSEITMNPVRVTVTTPEFTLNGVNVRNASGLFSTGSVPIARGGTGQTSANAAARALGLAKTKGDSFTLNYVNAVGFLTNSRKQAVVTVYFPYLIYGITSGNSCTLSGTFTARQNSGYCFGSTSTTPANLTSVTVSITRIQNGALTFSITGGEQTAAINNDPIALYFTSLTVTLT